MLPLYYWGLSFLSSLLLFHLLLSPHLGGVQQIQEGRGEGGGSSTPPSASAAHGQKTRASQPRRLVHAQLLLFLGSSPSPHCFYYLQAAEATQDSLLKGQGHREVQAMQSGAPPHPCGYGPAFKLLAVTGGAAFRRLLRLQ